MAETAQNITKNIYWLKGKIQIGNSGELVIDGDTVTDLTDYILELFEEQKSFIKEVKYNNQTITIYWNGIDNTEDSTTTINLSEFFNQSEIETYLTNKLNNLNYNVTNTTSKTLTSFKQENGKITEMTFTPIKIEQSQVEGLSASIQSAEKNAKDYTDRLKITVNNDSGILRFRRIQEEDN